MLRLGKFFDLFSLRSRFTYHVTGLMVGTLGGQLIQVLILPVLSRMYSRQQFGHFATYAAILGISTHLTCCGYDTALVLPRAMGVVRRLAAVCIGLTLLGGGIWLAGGGLAPAILAKIGGPEMLQFRWLFPLHHVLMGMLLLLTGLAVRKERFPALAASRIAGNAVMATVQVLLGISALRQGSMGLALGWLCLPAVSCILLLGSVPQGMPRLSFQTLQCDVKKIYRAAYRYHKFLIYTTPSNVLNAATYQLPILMTTRLFGATYSGPLAIATRLLTLPISLLCQSLGTVYYKKASELVHANDYKELRRFTFRLMKRILLLAIIPAAVLFLFAPWACDFILGHEWRETGVYVRILVPLYVIMVGTAPLTRIFYVLERQRWELFFQVCYVFIAIISFLAGHRFDNFLLALTCFSVLGTLRYLAMVWAMSYSITHK